MVGAIVYTADAAQDLESICDYVAARDGPERASELFELLVATIERLAAAPEQGTVPKELDALETSGFREVRHKPYRIVYEIADADVIVYGVLDDRRDMQTFLQQRLTR